MTEESVRLALASTPLKIIDDRNQSDLVFRFDREVSKMNRSVHGEQIQISVRWNCTLEVLDKKGQPVWKDFTEMDYSKFRKDKSQEAKAHNLRCYCAGILADRFVSELSKHESAKQN